MNLFAKKLIWCINNIIWSKILLSLYMILWQKKGESSTLKPLIL